MINQNIDGVIRSYDLRGRAVYDLAKLFVGLLGSYIEGQYGRLSLEEGSCIVRDGVVLLNGKEKREEYVCAMINNCVRCVENMEEVKEKLMDRLPEIDEAEGRQVRDSNASFHRSPSTSAALVNEKWEAELENLFDDTEDLFVDLGIGSVTILLEVILDTLKDNLNLLFTNSW